MNQIFYLAKYYLFCKDIFHDKTAVLHVGAANTGPLICLKSPEGQISFRCPDIGIHLKKKPFSIHNQSCPPTSRHEKAPFLPGHG
jgi:hypothetical protein